MCQGYPSRMSTYGPFETFKLKLDMSACRVRREMIGTSSKRR
jgi:hypothetical protein